MIKCGDRRKCYAPFPFSFTKLFPIMSISLPSRALVRPFTQSYRLFSISALRADSVGYGDLWDNDHDCPDHGHFKDNQDKMQAGKTIATSLQAHNVTDYYEKVNPDDAGDYGSKKPTVCLSCVLFASLALQLIAKPIGPYYSAKRSS
jgi:hypothetical protein